MNLNIKNDTDHQETIYLVCPTRRNYMPFHPLYTENCSKFEKNVQIQALDSEVQFDQYSTKRQALYHQRHLQYNRIQYPNIPDESTVSNKLRMRNNCSCKYEEATAQGPLPFSKRYCRECPDNMKRDSCDAPTSIVTKEDENLITALAEKLLTPNIHSSGFNGGIQKRPYEPPRNDAHYAQYIETDSSSDDIYQAQMANINRHRSETSKTITLPKLSGQIADVKSVLANVLSYLVAEKMNSSAQTAVAQKKSACMTTKSLCPLYSIDTQCNIELMSADISDENGMLKYSKKKLDSKPKLSTSEMDEWLYHNQPPCAPTTTVDRSHLNKDLMRLLTPYKSKHKMLLARIHFLENEVKHINESVKLLMDENKQLASRVVNAEDLTTKIRNIYTKALMKQQSQISNPNGQIPLPRSCNKEEGVPLRELLQQTSITTRSTLNQESLPAWSTSSQKSAATPSVLNQENAPTRSTPNQESAVTRSSLNQETAGSRSIVNQGNLTTWKTSCRPIAATCAVTRNTNLPNTTNPIENKIYSKGRYTRTWT